MFSAAVDVANIRSNTAGSVYFDAAL